MTCAESTAREDHDFKLLPEPKLIIAFGPGPATLYKVTGECRGCGAYLCDEGETTDDEEEM